MDPVNNCNTTNEISPSSVAEKYGITEEYSKKHPEDSARALVLARRFERASQAMDRLEQVQKEVSCGLIELGEGNKTLLAQQVDLIELEKKNTESLQNLKKSSSELKEMTSNIANMVSICANRIFNPVRNRVKSGFYLLTGRREPAAVLPRENQLAIEDNPENTIPITDTTNQTSDDEKKKCAKLLNFFISAVGLYILYSKAQKIFWCSSVDPQSI